MSIRELSKELQEVAIKEINEDPQRILSDLAYIKEWLSKQQHITARIDDQFLIAFLRGTKFSLERTKEKLDMHYTLKTITPEIYKKRDPFAPEIQKILSLGASIPLPKLTHPGGPRYFLARNGFVEKHQLAQADMFICGTMIQDIMMLEDDNLAVSGIVIVQDMSDVTMGFMKLISLTLMKKAIDCFQHGYPHRIKGFHFFNIPTIFDISLEELHQTIPKEVLPEEYGGQGGKIADLTATWKAKVENYKEWFAEDEKFGTDEKKRPGKPKTAESVFGLEGSFRQLSVD